MVGRVTCAFTGRQGTGKTTAMVASIAYIDARLTLRILEMAPEMYLRERYPDRNVYSVAETQYVSAAELQDALKSLTQLFRLLVRSLPMQLLHV